MTASVQVAHAKTLSLHYPEATSSDNCHQKPKGAIPTVFGIGFLALQLPVSGLNLWLHVHHQNSKETSFKTFNTFHHTHHFGIISEKWMMPLSPSYRPNLNLLWPDHLIHLLRIQTLLNFERSSNGREYFWANGLQWFLPLKTGKKWWIHKLLLQHGWVVDPMIHQGLRLLMYPFSFIHLKVLKHSVHRVILCAISGSWLCLRSSEFV